MDGELNLRVGPRKAPDMFRLVTALGSDARGDAWLAMLDDARGEEQAVAIKICPSVDEPDAEASWDIYAQLLIRLRHPNIVAVRDGFTGTAGHAPGESSGPHSFRYVVMDYIPGPTFERWLADDPHTSFLVRRDVLSALAAGLDKLHSGYVLSGRACHGEVTLSNVIMRSDGTAVLVDIGPGAGTRSPEMAVYLAPEQRRADAAPSVATDAFAFGVSAAQALIGAPAPRDASGYLDTAALAATLRAHPVTRWRPVLRRRIMSLLSDDPACAPSGYDPCCDWRRARGPRIGAPAT